MSETETHIGKAREFIRLEGESTVEYVTRFLQYKNVDNIEKLIVDCDGEYDELIADLYGRNYNRSIKRIDPSTVVFVNDVIYELIEHQEPDGYNFNQATRNADGTISFIFQFYNGGTCFNEVFDHALEKIKTT